MVKLIISYVALIYFYTYTHITMNFPEQINEHLLPLWQDSTLQTPAFVYDEAVINEKLALLEKVAQQSECHILYSIKALSFTGVLNHISQRVDGFSTSSVFESRLAREVLGDRCI